MHKILKETIYGNSAIVFHRTSVEDLINKVYTEGWKPKEGSMYGKGFYATYDLESQLKDWMRKNYGNIIVKFVIHNIDKYFIFNYNEFKKSLNYKKLGYPDIYNFIESQIKYFNISFSSEKKPFNSLLNKVKNLNSNNITSHIALFLYNNSNLRYKVDGIIFTGKHDGNVLVSYNLNNIIPVSYSIDEGETFYKVPYNIEYLKKIILSLGSPYYGKQDPRYYGIEDFSEYIDPNNKTIKKFYRVRQNVHFKYLEGSFPFLIASIKGNLIVSYSKLTDLSLFPREVSGSAIFNKTCEIDSLRTLPIYLNIEKEFRLDGCYKSNILDNLPQYCKVFNLSNNQIESFSKEVVSGPLESIDTIILDNNQLKDFFNFPKRIYSVSLKNNNLTELTNFKEKNRSYLFNLDISYNNIEELSSLPNRIQHLKATNNKIKTLKGMPIIENSLILDNNELTTLDELPKEYTGKYISIKNNPIKDIELEKEKVNKFYKGKVELIY